MKAKILFLLTVVISVVSIFVLAHSPARAAGSWYVSNSGNDSNACTSPATACASINGALNKPGFVAGDTVLVATGVYTGTGAEVVLLNKDVTLLGGWNTTFITQTGMATIDGQGTHRGVTINSGIIANIDRFIIQNGFASYKGGGIYNVGTLKLSNSTVRGNVSTGAFEAGGGGGIGNWGTLILTNATVSENTMNGDCGGGIFNSTSTVILNNTTISRNNADIGGGLCTWSAITVRNTLFADNSQDCAGAVNSAGYNLVQNTSGCGFSASTGDLLNVNAKLYTFLFGSPAYNPLRPDSPAIDTGNPAGCKDQDGNILTTDQRGTLRPLDGDRDGSAICDIGAYEFDPNNPIRQVYLPLISKPIILGINGHVTLNGVAASGVPLDLRFYNGSAWSTLASTTTDASGLYSFNTAPSLTSGQKYYVRYSNSSDPSRLAIWQTRSLTSYTAGTDAAIGNFDIANIVLVSPNSGAVVTLPQTFSWGVRGAVPTDSYEFNLFNPNSSNGQPWWWTVPPLGYVGGNTLNSLPLGFNINTWYGWFVAVYSPDGGYGESYYYRSVGFLNTGLGPVKQSPSSPKNIPERSTFMPRSKLEGAR